MTRRPLFPSILVIGLIVVTTHCKPATKKASDVTSSTQDTSQPADSSQPAPAGLAGTSWRLVKFQSSDESVLKPDDKSKYTITFAPDGKLGSDRLQSRNRYLEVLGSASARVRATRPHPYGVPAGIDRR
jgi:hypothetical protein